ncbi:MAG: HDOD domain-containing protein [Pseudomonadota bacterium]|nr:HDOD domain-containing protein [Pseudomonadota bacterium]
MNPYLDELLSRPANLPTVPAVVQRVLESFGDPDVSLHALGQHIGMDPVIAAKLLRLANSAYFRARREIRSVDEALQMLGMTTVRNVVLGCGIKEAFAPIPGLDLRALWRHGLQTACAARWLGRQLKLDAEFAFTASLMLGLGQLLLHRAMPERARQIEALVPVLAPGRAAVELRALHFSAADASAALTERWALPASMGSTLAAVPDPLHAPAWSPVAACIHLAAWAVWCQQLTAPPEALHGGDYPAQIARKLGLAAAWWPEMIDALPGTPAPAAPPAPARMPAIAELTAGLEELMS